MRRAADRRRRRDTRCFLGASRARSARRAARGSRFAVSYPESLAKGPLDGRLLLLLSTDASAEPRFQISDSDVAKSQQVFGVDVLGWKPGEDAVFDASVLGYPGGEPRRREAGRATACRRCSTGTRPSTAPTATW